jgi:small subunit ribosomal protein S8
MDAIADLIITIKNASNARKETAVVPHSNVKEAIVEVLVKEGFVKSVAKKGKKVQKTLEIGLAYDENGPRIKDVERVSHLSKRVYSSSDKITPVKQGHGVMIVSTSKGIMTDTQARKEKVGGELLFKIW